MADFKVIETQEAFDEAIKSRLQRERDGLLKEYGNEKSQLEQEVRKLQKELEEAHNLTTRNTEELEKTSSELEGLKLQSLKTRIAISTGLPPDLANRLQGTTEKELEEDAQSMKQLIGTKTSASPLRTTEPEENKTGGGFQKILRDIKGE